MEKKQLKSRLIILSVLLVVFLSVIIIETTISRYIKQERDEIKAYYTSLYLDNNGGGMVISLEENVGYITFDLMNYIGEDVTQSDIIYEVREPSKYYNANGTEITNGVYTNGIYVLDVWNQPQKLENDTYKYKVNVASNKSSYTQGNTATKAYTTTDGEGNETTKSGYLFEYVKRYEDKNDATAINHTITLKVERTATGAISNFESLSLVVQLIYPYKEVFIINVKVSEKLISFSSTEQDLFGLKFQKVFVQSVDNYSHYLNESTSKYERRPVVGSTNKYFGSKAFKITVTWSGLRINDTCYAELHKGFGNDYSNIDITKPYLISYNRSVTDEVETGTLSMYVPESSDFELVFDELSDTYNLSVTEIKFETLTYNSSDQSYTSDSELASYIGTNGGYKASELVLLNYVSGVLVEVSDE